MEEIKQMLRALLERTEEHNAKLESLAHEVAVQAGQLKKLTEKVNALEEKVDRVVLELQEQKKEIRRLSEKVEMQAKVISLILFLYGSSSMMLRYVS